MQSIYHLFWEQKGISCQSWSFDFTAGDLHDRPPAAMTLGGAQFRSDSDVDSAGPMAVGSQSSQQQEAVWRQDVLVLLRQLVQAQRTLAEDQAKIIQLLGVLGTQVSPTDFSFALV